MRRSLILFLFVSVILFVANGCKKDPNPATPLQVIKIGSLLSLTGEWSNLGISSQAALEIGVKEINAYYQSKNLPYRLSLSVEDSQLNPSNAAALMQNFASQGIQMVIGPQSSSEVAAIKSIADDYGILVVSQGSTASSMAIVGDAIYRLCPGDQIEGAAMAESIYGMQKKGLIVVGRNDVGNLGLMEATAGQFETLGGEVYSAVVYDPNTVDFSSSLDMIREGILALGIDYNPNEIGVYLASFDEAVQLFEQAAGDPILSSVQWFGGDGFIKNQALLSNTNAASFALATSFFSPEFGLPAEASNIWEPLQQKVYAQCGLEADAFTLAAYDALWMMAKMIEQNKGAFEDPFAQWDAFENIAQQYNGATGSIMLNPEGDRANGSFDYWGLEWTNGTYNWVKVGQSE